MPEESKPKMAMAFDQDGNPIQIPLDEWRDQVLPRMLEETWGDPNLLYGVVTLAADNGLASEVIEAVERAAEMDDHVERAAVMRAVIYFRADRIDDAEKILDEYLAQEARTPSTLATLARIRQKKGDNEGFENLLGESLQMDPNQDQALAWWADHHRDAYGEERETEALQKIAKHEGAWLPLIYLANKALRSGDKFGGIDIYKNAIEVSNYHKDALTVAAGDMLQHGHLIEMIDIIEPIYDSEVHGPNPGWSLVKGYLQTGQKRKGIMMLNKIEDPDRLDMKGPMEEMRERFTKLPEE